jgi:2'-5' RNA ligase
MGGIAEALKEAARGVSPFVLTANGLGGFPNLTRPRVLWVGLGESQKLNGLHQGIDERLEGLGFERDERAFNPHLTLCRLKTREASLSAARLLSGVAEDLSMDFRVDSFVLFKSVLSSRGAEHTPLDIIRLEG